MVSLIRSSILVIPLSVFALLNSACGDDAAESAVPETRCHTSDALCDKRFDEVAFAMTHNGYSSEEDEFLGPNHKFGIEQQLEDGIRGFMLDVYEDQDTLTLCHSNCEIGSRSLAGALETYLAFLEANPRDFIVIIFESYVAGQDLAVGFQEAGLESYAYAHDPSTPWPTLQELIDTDKRLIVFTDRSGGDPAWMMPIWDHAWETPWSINAAEEFTCEPTGRGDTANQLFIFNHFITNPIALPAFAEEINTYDYLLNRAKTCEQETGDTINFINVDFYSIGGTLDVENALNTGQ